MPKIIEICDVNSQGHRVRLEDGSYALVPHGTHDLTVGNDTNDLGVAIVPELELPKSVGLAPVVGVLAGKEQFDIETGGLVPTTIAPTLEQLNSPAQVAANILSEQVQQNAVDTKTDPVPAE